MKRRFALPRPPRGSLRAFRHFRPLASAINQAAVQRNTVFMAAIGRLNFKVRSRLSRPDLLRWITDKASDCALVL